MNPAVTVSQDRVCSIAINAQIIPWIEQRTIPFFRLRKDVGTNRYEDGIIEKDRTGVFIRIGDMHFVLTASHDLDFIVGDGIPWCLSLSADEDRVPIPMAGQLEVSSPATLDIAAIKLADETAQKVNERHKPLLLMDTVADCQNSDGLFLIVGYPRAGARFSVQDWNSPHKITTESVQFIGKRAAGGWTHEKLNYSARSHVVIGMSGNVVSGTTGDSAPQPRHDDIEGISGCGIWLLAGQRTRKPLCLCLAS